MTLLMFTVPGEPRGKGRARIGKVGAHARMFTDKKTVQYESLVALAAHDAMAGAAPFDCPLDVHIRVRLAPVASASGKARAAMLSGDSPPAKRPDLDNVAKAVLDGCNAVAFTDDALIVSLNAVKVYAPTAGVDVMIRPYTARAA